MSSSPLVSPWLRPQSFAPSMPGSMISTSFHGVCKQPRPWVEHMGLGDYRGGYEAPRPPRVTVRMRAMSCGQQGRRSLEVWIEP